MKGSAILLHLNGCQHACHDAGAFEVVLQGERVLHGGEHAHVIGHGAIHAALGGGLHAAEDIASAAHNAQLDSGALHVAYLGSMRVKTSWSSP
jgi:uncharacterized protein (DUF39 family)